MEIPYHDGVLSGFRSVDDGQVYRIVSVDGRIFEIIVDGVLEFWVRDYWRGCIVSDIDVCAIEELPIYVWRDKLHGYSHGDDVEIVVHRYLNMHKGSKAMAISCSYGGSFLSICKEVRIMEIQASGSSGLSI